MNTIKNLKLVLIAVIGLLTFNSCVQDDEYNLPPANCVDNWQSNLTIAQLFERVDAANDILFFEEDLILEGYVISSDSTGNFFKTVSIQDNLKSPTKGLQIEMDRTNLFNNFPLGSKIKINLNGLYAGYDNGLLKIGETFQDGGNVRVGRMAESKIDKHVVRTCDAPENATPIVFANIKDAKASGIINTLVTIQNVQFADTGVTYANAANQQTVNLNIVGATEQTNGDQIVLRTSGFADFANVTVPEGSGSITAVLSKFGSTWQLFIRDTNDVKFDQPRYVVVDNTIFKDGFSNLNNWTTQNVLGAQVWETRNFGNPAPCAYMSGFASGNQANEDWLISNPIAVPAGLSTVTFSFETDKGFNGNPLEAYYTTNFTGDVNTTAWTLLPATFDTENDWNTWTHSGNLDVSAAIGGNLYVAFKYTSTTSGAATWELDNVLVEGE